LLKSVPLILAALAVVAGAVFVFSIGPRNMIGMLRYDTRRQGRLRVGDLAPDVPLVSLDGRRQVPLLSGRPDRPLVLVFGSFT
jgi:hypothetical protein